MLGLLDCSWALSTPEMHAHRQQRTTAEPVSDLDLRAIALWSDENTIYAVTYFEVEEADKMPMQRFLVGSLAREANECLTVIAHVAKWLCSGFLLCVGMG